MNYSDLEVTLKKNPSTWLVTGVAGFIGSHLAERLLELNQKVIGLDNFSTGFEKNISSLESLANFKTNFEMIRTDLLKLTDYQRQLSQVDFVLHQAALGSVPRSIIEPEIFQASNVDGFFTILNAARALKIKKFVFASSSSVYGDHPALPKKEEMTGRPLSPYAATKFINEVYATAYSMAYSMPTVGLRYFNVFGSRQNPQGAYAAVIPLWISSMLEGKDVFMNGDGLSSRDFCYIENVVQANILAAFSTEEANGKVFNIAVGERTTLIELFEILKNSVEKITGKKVAPAMMRSFREGDIPHSLASIEMAQKVLQYQPVIKIGHGLLETVKKSIKI